MGTQLLDDCLVYLAKKPDSFGAAIVLKLAREKTAQDFRHIQVFDKTALEIQMEELVTELAERKVFKTLSFFGIVPSDKTLRLACKIARKVEIFIDSRLDVAIYDKAYFLGSNIDIFETESPRCHSVTKLVFQSLHSQDSELPNIIDLIDKSVKSKEYAHYQVYRAITPETFAAEYTTLSMDDKACLFSISKIMNERMGDTAKVLMRNANFVNIAGVEIAFINSPSDYNPVVLKEAKKRKEKFKVICNYNFLGNMQVAMTLRLVNTETINTDLFAEIRTALGLSGYKYVGGGTKSFEEFSSIFNASKIY